ncbi:MAG: bifunctional aspartate kinase/homoserine dehydrogenase I, partial [Bacteroidetes bacterium]|nr:bifunctional aspartate kinase/homoserine dehydrogenase I [Bacteroidota bacterium]
LIAMSRLAAGGDHNYRASLRTLRKRHLDALHELVPSRRQKRVEATVRDLLDDLKDVLHGVFYTREITARTLDYVMSFGELLSSYIIAEALKGHGTPCTHTDSRQLIKTDETFGGAHVRHDLTDHAIQLYFRKHHGLHVVPGFVASTADNNTTTLGRGGSDLTASIYGAALQAEQIEIWTDVDGVMTADPRKVDKAFSLPGMTYEEAMEMSHFGAKVLHPPTMQPALDQGIPICIRNTFNPEFRGTVISEGSGSNGFSIKGISSIDEVAMLRIQGSGLVGVAGIGRRIFGALAEKNINVMLTSQASSEYSICLAVLPQHTQTAKQLIEKEFRYEIRDHFIDEVVIETGLSAVAIVGENMRRTPGVSGRLFQALGRNGINVVAIAQGSSELNVSILVAKEDEAKALNVLHDAFFLSGTKTINLFIVGTGLIGGTLLRQISGQKKTLLQERNLDIHVRAVANRSCMVIQDQGIPPHLWKHRLEESGTPIRLEEFVRKMKSMNLPNSVFVDCTASESVIKKYEEILCSSISIVTPNKKANAGSLTLYRALRRAALKHNVRFLYAANVGSGLPILSTIDDLVAGGDRILRIEGALSGTLSYIFNSFQEGTRWSEIVREAKTLGYTEPDPRDDLNGMDVGRKRLILAREAGHELRAMDIAVKPVIPRSLARARSVNEFMKKLPSLDEHFGNLRQKAADKGQVLRYIATWGEGPARVSLQSVPHSHPAAVLTGSGVTVALTTISRREHPVVISGPGAGAEVTASSVLADIIKIGYQQS